jgi:hypothetical protein
MNEENKTLPSFAHEIVPAGRQATIYFDGQSLQVTSITRHASVSNLLVCLDSGGKVALIDATVISAVVNEQPTTKAH